MPSSCLTQGLYHCFFSCPIHSYPRSLCAGAFSPSPHRELPSTILVKVDLPACSILVTLSFTVQFYLSHSPYNSLNLLYLFIYLCTFILSISLHQSVGYWWQDFCQMYSLLYLQCIWQFLEQWKVFIKMYWVERNVCALHLAYSVIVYFRFLKLILLLSELDTW